LNSSNKPVVLITGGAGFLGCALGRVLCETGHDVVAMDSLHPQVHAQPGRPADLHPDVQLLPVDVTTDQGWDSVLHLVRPDVIVHLAAETGTGQSLTEASRHSLVNVVGTARMLDALTRSAISPDHLLLASSRAVYGEGAWAATDCDTPVYPPIRSHDSLAAGHWEPRGADGATLRPLAHDAIRIAARPANVYAATKFAQENLCAAWSAATGTPLSVLRLQNVYGPGQSLTNSYTGIVTLFARLASQGQQIEVYEDGGIVRDFVYVDDVVRAFVAALKQPPDNQRLLDIGSGVPRTILELARTIARMYDAPEPVITGAFRDGDVRAAYADITAAERALSWRPQQDLEDGLAALFRRIEATGQSG
jgi:dTDP-L-rhamnose 4-epimerase